MRGFVFTLVIGALLLAACQREPALEKSTAVVSYQMFGTTTGNVYDVYTTDQGGATDTFRFQASPFQLNVGIREGEGRSVIFRVENTVSPSDTDEVELILLVNEGRRASVRGRPTQQLSAVID